MKLSGLFTVVIVMLIITISFLAGYLFNQSRNSRDMKDLTWYKSHWLIKEGWTSEFGQYCLYSFDHAKTWNDITKTGKKVIINGPVEKVRPGLLEAIEVYDALAKRGREGHPLDLSNPADVKLLTHAGFTVSKQLAPK